MDSPKTIVERQGFQKLVIGIILLNSAVLGVLTFKDLSPAMRVTLELVDNLCLAFFCFEIALKLIVYRHRYFFDGWNLFDFAVVAVALAPASGPLSALRALRVLRLLRLATAVPSMRRVINGMFVALPGGASVAGVLLLLYYVGAIIASNFFAKTAPEYFGTIGATFFTLFKMMTLEGWPDIAAKVLPDHPNAWVFFVTFIVFTTFTTLNLLFGIIVDAMEKSKEDEAREAMAAQGLEISEASSEIRLAVIENELKQIRALLEERKDAA